MERIDHHQLWRQIRCSLVAAPVQLRVALSAKSSAERRTALDRLARFVAGDVGRLVDGEALEAPGAPLPLFPDIAIPEEDPVMPPIATIESSPSFARWLLDQHTRTDAIGALAKQARLDPGFPRDGDARAVSKRLNAIGAEGDAHIVLEDAELDWLAI